MTIRKESKLEQADHFDDAEMTPSANYTVNSVSIDDYDPADTFGENAIQPAVPEIPGFHCAWIGIPTEQLNDHSRMAAAKRSYYTPVSHEEFDAHSKHLLSDRTDTDRGSKWYGYIRSMDTILMKCPTAIYEKNTKYLQSKNEQTQADLKRPPAGIRDNRVGTIRTDGDSALNQGFDNNKMF